RHAKESADMLGGGVQILDHHPEMIRDSGIQRGSHGTTPPSETSAGVYHRRPRLTRRTNRFNIFTRVSSEAHGGADAGGMGAGVADEIAFDQALGAQFSAPNFGAAVELLVGHRPQLAGHGRAALNQYINRLCTCTRAVAFRVVGV